MIRLYGEYRHKVDAKGRFALPAKFRKVLPEDLIITVEPMRKECLLVFPVEEYEEWVDLHFKEGFDPSNPEHDVLDRKLHARTSYVTLDSAGRINLDPNLRNRVGIDKDIVLVGGRAHVEIWDAEHWDEYCQANDF